MVTSLEITVFHWKMPATQKNAPPNYSDNLDPSFDGMDQKIICENRWIKQKKTVGDNTRSWYVLLCVATWPDCIDMYCCSSGPYGLHLGVCLWLWSSLLVKYGMRILSGYGFVLHHYRVMKRCSRGLTFLTRLVLLSTLYWCHCPPHHDNRIFTSLSLSKRCNYFFM